MEPPNGAVRPTSALVKNTTNVNAIAEVDHRSCKVTKKATSGRKQNNCTMDINC